MPDGARQLAAAIIIQACSDLDGICKKIQGVRKHCATGTLTKYIHNLSVQERYSKLPFITFDDTTVLQFLDYNNSWARILLDAYDITYLPKNITDKINYVKTAEKYCKECLNRHKDLAKLNLTD